MNTCHKLFAATVAACIMTASAIAAEASPTGTWKYTQQGRGGGPGVERTFTLELKDGKLTGTLKGYESARGPRPDVAISDASFKDGTIAFSTELSFGENKFVIKYTGKLEGDSIKGSIEFAGFNGGEPTKTDWTATRAK